VVGVSGDDRNRVLAEAISLLAYARVAVHYVDHGVDCPGDVDWACRQARFWLPAPAEVAKVQRELAALMGERPGQGE